MGSIGLVMMLAPAITPTLSGIILESLEWRWLFYISTVREKLWLGSTCPRLHPYRQEKRHLEGCLFSCLYGLFRRTMQI